MDVNTLYQCAKLLNFDVSIYDKYHKHLMVNIILHKSRRHSTNRMPPDIRMFNNVTLYRWITSYISAEPDNVIFVVAASRVIFP